MNLDADKLTGELGVAAAITAAPEMGADSTGRLRRLRLTGPRVRLMLVCVLGSTFGSSFLAITAVGLIMSPLAATFHWSRTEISGAITVLLLVGAVMTAVWGRLIDRVGAKWIVVFGIVCVGLVTGLLAFTTSALIPFYLGFAALGVGGAAAIGYTKVIGLMFSENRGKALAIFGMESSVVGALAPQILLRLQVSLGWRGMFLAMAASMLVAAVVMVFLLRGLDTQGEPRVSVSNAAPKRSEAAEVGDDASQVRRSPTFWLINLATMAGNLTFTGLLPHMASLAVSRGMTLQVAVAALSMQTLFTPVGQFSGGFVLDRARSARTAALPFAVIALVGVMLIIFGPRGRGGAPWLLIGAAVLGFGNGAKRSMNSYFFTRYFGLKTLAEASGLSIAATALVLAPAPLLFGLIFDRTRSYDLVLTIIAGGLVLTTLCYGLLGPYRYTADAGGLAR